MVLLVGKGVHIPIVCPSQTKAYKKTMERKIVTRAKILWSLINKLFVNKRSSRLQHTWTLKGKITIQIHLHPFSWRVCNVHLSNFDSPLISDKVHAKIHWHICLKQCLQPKWSLHITFDESTTFKQCQTP